MPTAPRTRSPIAALLGALAVVSAVVILTGPSGAAPGAEAPARRAALSVSDRDTDPPQSALHHVTTTPGGLALRLDQSDGCGPSAGSCAAICRPEWCSAAPALARAGENRPPLRVLFCTWLI